MDEQLSNKETVRGKSAVEFPSTDNPVADIDMQDLIDKQIETGEPIILIMPKNVPEEDLPSSSKDLLSSNEDAIDGISRAWIESLIPNHSEE